MKFMELFKKNKKGQLGAVQSVVIALVVIGFILVIGLTLMGKVRDTTTTNTSERNASVAVIEAMATIPDWLGIIVLAVIALVILGIVYMFARGAKSQ